jgi:PAS domain S-box-containing protein
VLDKIFSAAPYAFNATAAPPFIASAATLVVSIFVMVRERVSRVSLLFFVYALTASLWLFAFAMAESSPVEQVIIWWARAAHAALALLPAALYHFTVVVLQIDEHRRRSVRAVWIIGAVFLVMALFTDSLFTGLYRYSWGSFTRYTWSSVPFLFYFFTFMLVILRAYWLKYRASAQSTTKQARARELLSAFGIGYLATFDFLPAFGVPYHPLGSFPMLVMLVLIARVIWRHRLVDITPAFAANQIIETMSDALLVLDRENVIRLTNRSAAELFGRSEQDLIGMPVASIVTDPLFATEIDLVRSSGHLNNVEFPCFRAEGTVFLNFSVSLLCDKTGEPAGIVCVARDITDRKKMEADRLRSQKLESLGVLAGGIAHDFNNLLTGILGNISLAREYAGPEDAIGVHLLEAEKASLWARDLTQQLLTFSRGGAPVRKTAAIGELVRDATELALRGSRNRAEFHISPDLWTADVDEGQIRQVIQNLVLNADQAMPQGGVIEVACENAEAGPDRPEGHRSSIRITIRDRGIGIPPEHLPRIFDPYFSTKQKGSGLGLATAYSIVTKHGGSIEAESRPGEGAVFRVNLPASNSGAVPVPAPQHMKPVSGKGRILLMDDEELLLSIASAMLRRLGYTVVTAKDGQEAIRKYKDACGTADAFDVVVLDLTVPGAMGGKDAVLRLREIDPQVKAVVSSGYSQDPVMSDYEKHGFVGVVPKPYKLVELSETIQKAMTSV